MSGTCWFILELLGPAMQQEMVGEGFLGSAEQEAEVKDDCEPEWEAVGETLEPTAGDEALDE